MGNRPLGVILVIVGIALAALSLLADVIGIGGQPGIIGWKQVLGTVAGIVFAVVGALMLRSAGRAEFN